MPLSSAWARTDIPKPSKMRLFSTEAGQAWTAAEPQPLHSFFAVQSRLVHRQRRENTGNITRKPFSVDNRASGA
jgi:hypothetical protein